MPVNVSGIHILYTALFICLRFVDFVFRVNLLIFFLFRPRRYTKTRVHGRLIPTVRGWWVCVSYAAVNIAETAEPIELVCFIEAQVELPKMTYTYLP